ncbi:MAG: HAD-IIB family hydrolase [Candidatus Levyibacteriota bacterium]|jgi:HAD superfamily hydrolase (TIGR01484 family)
MSSKRKFKAIICDIDGTLILNKRDALPSKKVIKAIKKANKFIHVGVATSRPLFAAQRVIEVLELSGLCILYGGSQIYDSLKKSVVWEKPISKSCVKQVSNILKKSTAPVFIPNELKKENILLVDANDDRVLQFWVHGIEIEELHELEKALAKIKDICAHRIPSWKKGLTDLTITHKNASKTHGIHQLIRSLGLKKKDIIAIGDGMNDIPLFKACGFKVAMGNASPELKAIADYVAPPVEKDGIVDVIEKFIL